MSHTVPKQSLPSFPVLEHGKSCRVITKHYTNLLLWLPHEEMAILTWLIYRSKADNVVEYSTHLLEQYSESIKQASLMYMGKGDLKTSIVYHRNNIRRLINKGLLIDAGKKLLMINPMITYNPDVINGKRYKEVMDRYQDLKDSGYDFCQYYTGIVAEFLQAKKINYVYRSNK